MTYVYFIANERQSVVKIGVARKPMRRLKTFQTANHEELTILRVIKVTSRDIAFQLESALHEKFKEEHIRGEWFSLTKTLFEFIENYQEAESSLMEQSISYLSILASALGVTLVMLFILNGHF